MSAEKTLPTYAELLWALRDMRKLSGSDWIVLQILALRCDPKKQYSCDPSVLSIALDGGMAESTVHDSLNFLRVIDENDPLALKKEKKRRDKSLEVVFIKERKGGRNIYYLDVKKIMSLAAASRAARHDQEEPRVSPFPLGEDELVDEQPSADDEQPKASAKTKGSSPERDTLATKLRELAHVGAKLREEDAKRCADRLIKECPYVLDAYDFLDLDKKALLRASGSENAGGYIYKVMASAYQVEIEKFHDAAKAFREGVSWIVPTHKKDIPTAELIRGYVTKMMEALHPGEFSFGPLEMGNDGYTFTVDPSSGRVRKMPAQNEESVPSEACEDEREPDREEDRFTDYQNSDYERQEREQIERWEQGVRYE